MLQTKSERDETHASSVRSHPLSTSSYAGLYTSPGSSAHNSDSMYILFTKCFSTRVKIYLAHRQAIESTFALIDIKTLTLIYGVDMCLVVPTSVDKR